MLGGCDLVVWRGGGCCWLGIGGRRNLWLRDRGGGRGGAGVGVWVLKDWCQGGFLDLALVRREHETVAVASVMARLSGFVAQRV